MAVSSVSITSVNLYTAAARSQRERAGCEHPAAEPEARSEKRGSVLADAMLGALRSLGWSRAEGAPAAEGTASPGASVEDAVAEFAHALADALRGQRRPERHEGGSEGRSEGHGHGHCHGRGHHDRGYRGIAPRIEMLVVQLQAGTPPAQGGAAPVAAGEPVVALAPPPEPMIVPAPEETDADAPALLIAPEAAAIDEAAATDASDQPLIVAPPPAPEEPERLVDAFKKLLDSLRDNGLKSPLEESPGEALARFLMALADGLKPAGPGARYGTMPVFSGAFIRITA